MLKGIVFDLDGTLVDSLQATFDAFNHGILQQGGRKHTGPEILKYFGPGEGEIFAQILGPDKADAAYAACRAFMDANLGRVPLHAGVGDLLERIKSAGVPIAIVTGRSWDTTEMILKHHGILDRFVTVISNDHVGNPKPSPEGILKAVERLKLSPEHTIYVGDSWVDMRAARAAGAGGVAALWDLLADRASLEPHVPHHWASTPAEVWEFWERASAGAG